MRLFGENGLAVAPLPQALHKSGATGCLCCPHLPPLPTRNRKCEDDEVVHVLDACDILPFQVKNEYIVFLTIKFCDSMVEWERTEGLV